MAHQNKAINRNIFDNSDINFNSQSNKNLRKEVKIMSEHKISSLEEKLVNDEKFINIIEQLVEYFRENKINNSQLLIGGEIIFSYVQPINFNDIDSLKSSALK